MDQTQFNTELLAFLDASPTPWHATANMAASLAQAGFERLDEDARWQLQAGGQYFVTRNESSIAAFTVGQRPPEQTGFQMVGAHTDSPCLKLKPLPVTTASGYVQLAVEVYGGVLLNPWFDRDLSLAGRVSVRRPSGGVESHLVNFERAVGIVPSLAIHLDREANKSRAINPQTYLPVVVGLAGEQEFDLHARLRTALTAHDAALATSEILDFELSFYDTQPAGFVGFEDEFIASARLDNLLSCYCAMQSIKAGGENVLMVCNDHEEVGSNSTSGARGTFLKNVVERIAGANESMAIALAKSTLVSTDNAHGVHPNFPDRHDNNHGPVLNKGPALKFNANQAYATNSETSAEFQNSCAQADVPVQRFVSRNDMACGSTIGPLTATTLGVRTVDVGVPTFAMHSIRELAGNQDAHMLYRALKAFFQRLG